MCREILKTLSILALLEADWSTAWGSQDDRGDDTHLVGDFAQAGFVQSNPCQLSQASCPSIRQEPSTSVQDSTSQLPGICVEHLLL